MSPVQRAFQECHGLQCGFCTPGFLCTVTALLRDNPAPDRRRGLEGISGNLCRCTGYQNIIKAVHRAADLIAEDGTERGPVTSMFGEPIVRREDPRLITGQGRYLDDLGRDALAAAFVRSPHAHARVTDIDVDDAARRRGAGGDLHVGGPARTRRGAAAAADPAPGADPRAHGVPAGPRRRTARRRTHRHGGRPRPLPRRGRRRADPGDVRAAAAGRRHRERGGGRRSGARRTCRATSAPTSSRRSGGRAAPRSTSGAERPGVPARHRAQRVDAAGGTRRLRPLGRRRRVAARLLLDADVHERTDGDRRQARPAARTRSR